MPQPHPESVRLAGGRRDVTTGPKPGGRPGRTIRHLCAILLAWVSLACARPLDLSSHGDGAELSHADLWRWQGPVPEDPATWAALPDSGFRNLEGSGEVASFRPGPILLRVRLSVPDDGTWWIREDYVDVDSVRAETGGRATCWIGEDVPKSRWCTPWHGLWLPLDLRRGENLAHLQVVERTGRLGISVQVESDRIRQERAEDEALRDGLLVGILLANLLIAVFLFALVRRKAHFWYVFYQTVVIAFVFSGHQRSFDWLWPEHPALNQILPSFGSIGAFGGLALFLTHLLDLHVRFGLLGRIFRWQGFALVGLCLLQVAIPWAPWVVDLLYGSPAMELVEIASFLLGIVLVVRLAVAGSRQALVTSVAMVPMVVALAVSLGGELVHQPWMYSSRGLFVEIALCLENILFSALLVWKVGLERRRHQGLLERHLALEREFNDHLARATDRHLRGTALDLHDGVGQDLAALRFQAEALGDPESWTRRRERFLAELARVSESVRSTAHGLYPQELHGGDLVAALRRLGERLLANRSLELRVHGKLDGQDESRALQWYRIVQEAIQNAQKHGGARTIEIRLLGDRLEVHDDGSGLAVPLEEGAGLHTIRARASRLGAVVTLEPSVLGGVRLGVSPRA